MSAEYGVLTFIWMAFVYLSAKHGKVSGFPSFYALMDRFEMSFSELGKMNLDKSRFNLYLSKNIRFLSCNNHKQGFQYTHRVRQCSLRALSNSRSQPAH